jgi:tryptophan halogenase
MVKDVVIVGGGTAGWLTAAYLARILAAGAPRGARITLVESPEIGILGVGEGTFPSIRNTLQRIGIDEADFLRGCNATFKQGIRFDDWLVAPGEAARDHYFHPFQSAQGRGELDLLPYWLQGCADPGLEWDEAVTLQKAVADASLGPKRPQDGPYGGIFNYAYHFDAVRFAALLRDAAKSLGVRHVVDTVDRVEQAETGDITGVATRENGMLAGDLFIDCSGFRAELIGKALGEPLRPFKDSLFCDRAVAIQVPYDRPDAAIPSYTICAAQRAGWMWDIGLDSRRGIGHVYSSSHMDDDEAEKVIRAYIGPPSEGLAARSFKFNAGYRERSWVRNCVAVGLAGGFFEPLEATGIVFIEVAAILIANLFPWAGEMETAARQFNRVMSARYGTTADFLKLHYCLSRRRDSDFWRDNADPATWTDSLKELLDRWRTRPPEAMDFDMNYQNFTEGSWQFVLYGMGFKTDLSARAGAYSRHDQAKAKFAEIRRHTAQAVKAMPTHRALIDHIRKHGFQPPQANHFLNAASAVRIG